MDREAKIKISNLGIVVALVGILSTLFYFLPFDLIVLVWIDFFGETVGWLIRITIILLGFFLYFKYDQPDIEDSDVIE